MLLPLSFESLLASSHPLPEILPMGRILSADDYIDFS
jgi:hypothetical protein